jgi:glycosyltransferase involved in cell wall biosynthesis
MFDALHSKISQQIAKSKTKEVELLSNDQMDISTGEKRNLLINQSSGKFVVFVDDDDDVYDCYVEEIINAINQNPNVDCIGVNGIITFAGEHPKRWFLSNKYACWQERPDCYVSPPNHIAPIRKSIAIKATFPHITFGEDNIFAMSVKEFLTNEVVIEKPIYHYKSRTYHQSVSDGGIFRRAWR